MVGEGAVAVRDSAARRAESNEDQTVSTVVDPTQRGSRLGAVLLDDLGPSVGGEGHTFKRLPHLYRRLSSITTVSTPLFGNP